MSLKDRVAPVLYDFFSRGPEKAGLAGLRHRLLAQARGRVLEIGVGTGLNLPHYPPDVEEIVVLDPTAGMLRRAEQRAGEHGRTVTAVQGSAEELPFPDDSFDTVAATAVLCTVPDADRALAEIKRVLRPDGMFLFAEHVRSDDPGRARWQDRLERIWGVVGDGCHPNRRTLERIEAVFTVEDVEHLETPKAPAIVRPLVVGRATAR